MNIFTHFLIALQHYVIEITPALVVGFLLSGIIHEYVPDRWIETHLGDKGMKGVLWATLIGALVPVCCWGCLPIAVSFRKKGARLGPILAMLVATPATSVNALIVTIQMLGLMFGVWLCISVVVMGLVTGYIGNRMDTSQHDNDRPCTDTHCAACSQEPHVVASTEKKSFVQRVQSVLRFAYIQMPKDIGKQTLIGLVLAAAVQSIVPASLVQHYLHGAMSYVFALLVGITTYMCATMSVPLVQALIQQGMNVGAAFVFLLVGPITSYGTLLVLNKEFGPRVLVVYLLAISIMACAAGYVFTYL